MIYAQTKNVARTNKFFKSRPKSIKNTGYRPPQTAGTSHPTPVICDHLTEQIANHESQFNNIISENTPPDVKASAITKSLKNIKNLDKARKRKAGAIFKVTKKIPRIGRQRKRPDRNQHRENRERGNSPINLWEGPDMNIRHLYDGEEEDYIPRPAPRPAAAATTPAYQLAKMQSKTDPEKKERLARFRNAYTPEKPPRPVRTKNLFGGSSATRKRYGKGLKKNFNQIVWHSSRSTSKNKTKNRKKKVNF